MTPAYALARLCLALGRRAWARLPPRARKELEDRFFWAIFQRTRVENDAYGWRPPPPGGSPPGPPEAR